jgi:protocatechuate 3,4-dioxygenase beta subunit
VNSKSLIPNYPPDTPGVQPPYFSPDYKSTALRSPMLEPIDLPQRLTEVTNPVYGVRTINSIENDLTKQHEGEPQGQRIIVFGKVVDSNNQPIKNSLIEIWQANAGGRYRHVIDNWDSPLDPNFSGVGRTTTNENGEYEFITVKPGAYPWRNHHNAWRLSLIHI